jgi:hypothetical protein
MPCLIDLFPVTTYQTVSSMVIPEIHYKGFPHTPVHDISQISHSPKVDMHIHSSCITPMADAGSTISKSMPYHFERVDASLKQSLHIIASPPQQYKNTNSQGSILIRQGIHLAMLGETWELEEIEFIDATIWLYYRPRKHPEPMMLRIGQWADAVATEDSKYQLINPCSHLVLPCQEGSQTLFSLDAHLSFLS